jgi:ankyrin repeat protein
LHFASALDNQEITQLVLNAIPESLNSRTKVNQTPLHIACSKNKNENIKLLLSCLNIELTCIDDNGFTPLIKACSALSYDAASLLLSNIDRKDLLLNNKDKAGNTALHYTMEDNNLKLSIELIKHGVKYDVKNNDGHTCFGLIKDNNLKSIILNYVNSSG